MFAVIAQASSLHVNVFSISHQKYFRSLFTLLHTGVWKSFGNDYVSSDLQNGTFFIGFLSHHFLEVKYVLRSLHLCLNCPMSFQAPLWKSSLSTVLPIVRTNEKRKSTKNIAVVINWRFRHRNCFTRVLKLTPGQSCEQTTLHWAYFQKGGTHTKDGVQFPPLSLSCNLAR